MSPHPSEVTLAAGSGHNRQPAGQCGYVGEPGERFLEVAVGLRQDAILQRATKHRPHRSRTQVYPLQGPIKSKNLLGDPYVQTTSMVFPHLSNHAWFVR